MTGKLFDDLFCPENSQFGDFRGTLCPMIRLSGLPSAYQHRSPQWLPRWQRLLLGCYSALFALVLPFICWGALAEPGHPHRTPHFVFADPLPNKPMQAGPMQAGPMQAGKMLIGDPHGGVHPVVATMADPAICRLQPDDPVAGQATPTLLLFTILLLLLAATWALGQLARAAVACWLQPLLGQARFIAVPLPPPRALSSTFA